MDKLTAINSKDIKVEYKSDNEIVGTREHYHNAYEVAFFIKANIKIFAKNIKYNIGNGDLLFINQYDLHKIVYNNNSEYIRFVLNIKKRYLKNILKEINAQSLLSHLEELKYKKLTTNLEERNHLQYFFNSLNNIKNNNPYPDRKLQEGIIKSQLITLTSQIHNLFQDKQDHPKISNKEKHVYDIIQFLDNNFLENIDLELLSARFHLNKYYISRIFKQVTGFSLIEYIQHKRIIQAQKILKNTNKEISDVCFTCGFNNLQHFYRVFKKITETTPCKFRNKN